ncbi:ABC transporter permease subunit [Paraburkholderia fungorum]
MAAAAFVPFFAGPWLLSTVRDALVMGILALSYDLLWGRAGVLALGHTTFLGLGAYGFAVATVQFGQAPVTGLVAGVLCAAAVAAVIGYFLLFQGEAAFLRHHQPGRADGRPAARRQLAVGDRGRHGHPGHPGTVIQRGRSHALDMSGPRASWYTVGPLLLAATGLVDRVPQPLRQGA